MNNVILIGRLTKDPDLRYTQGGKAVATFTVAVDKYSNGEKKADFINCVVWEKAAEALANYTKKGSKIGVKGSLNTRNYDNQQGQKVYVTEVVADRFNGIEFLDSKNNNQETNQSAEPTWPPKTQQSNQTNNNQSNYKQDSMPGMDSRGFNRDADPFSSASQIDIQDNDLPF